MFGRATIRLGIGPHSSFALFYQIHVYDVVVKKFTFAIYAVARPSVVCLTSVKLVRPTQAVEIFGHISTVLGTLAIDGHPLKISRRSSQGNSSAGGVKHKRGSQV